VTEARPGEFHHVAVIGPGAIGLCVAVRLARLTGGPAVTLIDHDGNRARRLSSRPLRIRSEAGDLEARVPVRVAAETAPDLVILATKAHQAQSAAVAAKRWIGQAPLVTLQNGLGAVAEVAEALPATSIVVGVTYQAANVVAEGVVHHAANVSTHLGYEGRRPDAMVEAVARLLNRAGLPARVEADITPILWQKLLVNAALNPVAALAGVPNGEVARRPALAALLRALAEEGEVVARAVGIRLPDRSAAEAALETARTTAENRCSMLQDLEAGRATEVDYLNGAIVRLAGTCDVPVPVNRAVAVLVRQVSGADAGGG